MTNKQAEKLRILAGEAASGNRSSRQRPRTIVIASGKGGVGKTTIAVNLSVALCDLGLKCGIVDTDLSLADAHLLFGHVPGKGLSDIVNSGTEAHEAFNRLPDGPWILPGLNGDPGMAALGKKDRHRITSSIGNMSGILEAIILDAAAGAGPEITDFALWADELILVLAPEPTSILDAYGLLKVYKRLGGNGPVKVIINRANASDDPVSVFEAFDSTSSSFLGLDITYLGAIPDDIAAVRAVEARRPLLRVVPQSDASLAIRRIAEELYGGLRRERLLREHGWVGRQASDGGIAKADA